ncbi:MAG: hypothetical protein IAG13_14025 [Deltaproteobacteria bacterium]|nr:hypothetical protein [Nannocystaceae bacterium]
MRRWRSGWAAMAMATAVPCACGGDSAAGDTGTTTTLTTTGSGSTSAAPPGDTTSGSAEAPTTSGTSTGDEPADTGSGFKLDVHGGHGEELVNLSGRVLAPNGEIPIPGALVVLTATPPAGLPDGVDCDECEALGENEFYATTAADGRFDLLAPVDAVDDAPQFIVVKKGQFLRIEPLEVMAMVGQQVVPESVTQLPGTHNPGSGRWIPQIGVYSTYPDAVYNVLAKFGLGEVGADGTLVPGSEQFTLLSTADQGALLDDLEAMSAFDIIFVPCATTVSWPDSALTPERIDTIRAYVAAGGRWYATDHSNEYVKEPFSAYLDLHSPGMPDIQPAYTVAGTIVDDDLLDWLEALPPELADIGGANPTLGMLPFVDLMDNYSGIEAVHEVIVQDDDGNDVDVGPHTFVSGPCTSCSDAVTERSMAISGQYGCGRMMYSTFETSSSPHQGLNPQELVLLYMILEIGGCQENLTPPPQG